MLWNLFAKAELTSSKKVSEEDNESLLQVISYAMLQPNMLKEGIQNIPSWMAKTIYKGTQTREESMMSIYDIRKCLIKHAKEGETCMEAGRLVAILNKCGIVENIDQAIADAEKAGVISTDDNGTSYKIHT